MINISFHCETPDCKERAVESIDTNILCKNEKLRDMLPHGWDVDYVAKVGFRLLCAVCAKKVADEETRIALEKRGKFLAKIKRGQGKWTANTSKE